MRKTLLQQILMPAVSSLTPFKSWQYLKEMCAADFEPLDVQRGRREELLAEVLSFAYDETELYREKLDSIGISPQAAAQSDIFPRVSATTKQDLRTGFPARQLARSYRSAWLRYSNTSGTSGYPLQLIQDLQDICYKYAAILRSRMVAGVDPLGLQVRITPNECQPFVPEKAGRIGGDCSKLMPGRHAAFFKLLERQVLNRWFHRRYMLDPFWRHAAKGQGVDYSSYIKEIDRLRPDLLVIYPLYALLLAKHMRRTGTPAPRIRGIIDFSGGLCTPNVREFISQSFGVRTSQCCGGCEFSRYGASCEADPDRMHLAETHCYVETVHSDGSACEPGELGNLLVTNLHGRAMPIIRLESGDVGRIVEEPCECGRLSRRIEHAGRIQGMILNADGQWVASREIEQELLLVQGMELFQLVQQSPDQYELHVIPEPGERIDEAAVDQSLGRLLGASARIKKVRQATIHPEASWKLMLVKSNTFEEFRVASARRGKVPIN